ncbi:MAG: dihydroorotase, partial [Planctomycetota bacterium]
DLARWMTKGPAEVLALPQRSIRPGAAAELTLIDPHARRRVDPERFLSKGRNTPFAGWELPACPVGTLNGRRLVLAADAAGM